jgi:hypothetical protein
MLYPLAMVLLIGGGIVCALSGLGKFDPGVLGFGVAIIIGGLILIAFNLVCSAACELVKAGVKLAVTADHEQKIENKNSVSAPTSE